jgi:hypothetical protein
MRQGLEKQGRSNINADFVSFKESNSEIWITDRKTINPQRSWGIAISTDDTKILAPPAQRQ